MGSPIYDDVAADMGEPVENLDWDVDRDGRMREHATDPDGEPTTVLWMPPLEVED